MDGRNVSDNGDDRDIYLLVALVDRLDLVSPCIELLNEVFVFFSRFIFYYLKFKEKNLFQLIGKNK